MSERGSSSQATLKNSQITMMDGKRNRIGDDLEMQMMENTLDKKWSYLVKISEMNSWLSSKQYEDKSEQDGKKEKKK